MSTVCPEGHTSADPDYCDHCGARIAPSSPEPARDAAPSEPPVETTAEPTVALDPCPACGAVRLDPDVRFCEACGHDLSSPPPTIVSDAPPAGLSAAVWEAVITADRLHFARSAPDSAVFPEDAVDRIIALTADRISIGRASATSDSAPEINLAQQPEDSAVSHSHAVLERQSDGAYAVVDHGSTNGTTINDNPKPIAHDVPVTLGAGDEIHIGMWTTIVIRRTGAEEPDG